MSSNEHIITIMNDLQAREKEPIVFDKERILLAYQQRHSQQNLSIKVVSVLGGLLASLAFSGFLFITGIYDSAYALLGSGISCLVIAILMSKKYDKIMLDTISISLYIIGLILLGLGLNDLGIQGSSLYMSYIALSLCSLVIVRRYLLLFIATLVINGSIVAMIFNSHTYDFLHIYASLLAVGLYYLFRREAKILSQRNALSIFYNPIRSGLIFSFLFGLIFLGKEGLVALMPNYNWITSLVFIAIIIFLTTTTLLPILQIKKIRLQILIYILLVFILLPTAASPAISGTIMLLLLTFLVSHRTGFVVSVIALIYFISQYYYDLHFTLLVKSILLCSSGIAFIILYLLTFRKSNK